MSVIRRFAQQVDFIAETRAPLNTDGARPQSGIFEKKLAEIHDLIVKPVFMPSDVHAYLDAMYNMGSIGIDDRELLLEKVLVLMSRLPDTEFSMILQQTVINLLYKDLPHPPSGYLCLPPPPPLPTHKDPDELPVKYAFRSADGSNYNTLLPTLGKAGSPYARSVPSTNVVPKPSLPDPGLVFDTLLRRDEFVPHPGGISALFFAFADLVIHSIFNTNHFDWTKNDASSYLDLSVLYGSSEKQVDSVRRKDGTGKLWNDVFADPRLLHMPPASCALLVLLSRNHNYIAEKILNINENRKYTKSFKNAEDRKLQDDEIFHRARLVNCGYFMHIILGDYVGAILGLVRDECDWRLDPLMPIRKISHEFVPVGEGNVVSIEFNLLYRWHATLSAQDSDWTGNLFNKMFDSKDPHHITIDDFKEAAHKYMIPNKPVKEWTFNDLTRDGQGFFKDEDLANILHNSTEWRAGAFKARGIPEALRVIEIMGIQQSRTWGTCSLNEFRKFLGLKPYKTFQEWNPEPTVHKAAAALYKDIDNLELHVGLQAEQPKEPGPGAGLCPGYTISRAILADAVCLTRGDRFLTVDFTPFNLTSWGYEDCQYDKKDGSYGGLLTKLLFRTLPNHYPRGSAYAHFPFLDPVYMKDHLTKSNPELAAKYTWSRPRRHPPTISVDTYAGVKQILTEPSFLSAYDSRLFSVVKPVLTKKMAKDSLRSDEKRQSAFSLANKGLIGGVSDVTKTLLGIPDADLASFFAKKTKDLIKDKTFKNVGKTLHYVDIVQDVINLVPIHWIAQEIAGLPLKTSTNPHGAWYEQDVCTMFSDIAEYVYLNVDSGNDWRLRESSQSNCIKIVEVIKGHIDKIAAWVSFSDVQNQMGIENSNSHAFLKKVVNTSGRKYSHREMATQVFAATVPTAALHSQAVAHVVNFFLDDDKTTAREEIVRLAKSADKDANSKILAYVHEALRLDPPVSGSYRTAAREIVVGPEAIQAFSSVFSSIIEANLDPTVFGPDPSVPNYARTSEKGGIISFGEYGLLSPSFLNATIPAILGAILSMKGLKRGPGRSGSFNRFPETLHNQPRVQYINSRGGVTQFPDSLIVEFESK